MPVTYKQLVDLVVEDNAKNGRVEVVQRDVEAIVKKTLDVVGLYVNEHTGEVYSPLPKPVAVFTPPRQQNVHWRGGRRR